MRSVPCSLYVVSGNALSFTFGCTGTEGDGMDANGSTSPSGGPEKLDGGLLSCFWLPEPGDF